MVRKINEIDKINNIYQDNMDIIQKEIISAIREGIQEGIEEGVKGGILEGLSECFDVGFLNISKIKTKKIQEILEEVAEDTIRTHVETRVKKEICPVLKNRMSDICKEILQLIKKQKITVDTSAMSIDGLEIKDIIDNQIDKIESELIPGKNFILIALFDGFHKAISDCIYENVGVCIQQIQNKIQYETRFE